MNNLKDRPTGETPNRALVTASAPAAVTPLGQLPFFTEFLQVGGLFDP